MNWLEKSAYAGPKPDEHPYLPQAKARELDRIIRAIAIEYDLRSYWKKSWKERQQIVAEMLPKLGADPTYWRSEVRQLLGVGG